MHFYDLNNLVFFLKKLTLSGSFCAIYILVDVWTWIIVFQYYSIMRHMAKLREEAIIPAPIVSPYPYFHENTVDSMNGLKHTLCNLEEQEYVSA